MPKKWLYIIDEAVKKIENHEIELGIQALQKVQEHGKDIPQVMFYLADVWYQLGHLDTAKELLKDIIGLPHTDEETSTDAKFLLAEIALDEGDFETAQEVLYEIKESGEEDIQLYLLLADLYAAQDLDDVSIKYLEMALKLEPDNEEIKAAIGGLYERMGEFSEAMSVFSEISDLPAPTLLMRGRMHAQHGEFEEAYSLFQQALKAQESVETLYACGVMAYHLGELDKATSYTAKLLELDGEYTVAYQLLADIHLSKGETELAIEALKTYVDLSGFDESYVQRLVALLLQAGRYEEARVYQAMLDQWQEEEQGVE